MRQHFVLIGMLFALAGFSTAHAASHFTGKKGFVKEPQDQGEDGGLPRGSIRPSGLVPSFPGGATCPAIASPFGSATRYDGSRRPASRYGGLHGGIDLTLDEGTPLRAIAAGRIISVGTGGQAEGIYLWLQHAPADSGLPFWVYSKYQHLLEVPRHGVGEAVQVGQVVGLSGKTGTTGGHYGAAGYPHLHLTTFAGRSDRYEHQGSRILAQGARFLDPVAIYVRDLNDLDEVERLSDDRKKVPIPYFAENGSIHPAGSRVVWPVSCMPR
ncbi:MAG: M23 family metallopeptidase [Betaproteobacteria bacterium]|nr:M23 family metallopeptidase [Betaproteobacteria bacterium]